MPMAWACSKCDFRLAVARLTLRRRFDSPEQQWLCPDCACDALQDWLMRSQWQDIEAVTVLLL